MFGLQVLRMSAEQMLILALFVVSGYLLVKTRLAPENTGTVLSKLEAFLFVPCLQFLTFWKYGTVENFCAQWKLILYGTIAAAAYGLIAVPLGRLLSKDPYERKLLYYSFVATNGYIGDTIVLGLFGSEAFFSYLMFKLPFVVYTYAIGVPSLMPGSGSLKSRLRNFCNPCMLSEILGLAFGLLSVKLPVFLSDAIGISADCMSPAAMILTGAVIAGFQLKDLFSLPRAWIAAAIRLLCIPAATVLFLKLLHADDMLTTFAVCYSVLPVGLNTVIFPTAYGKETRFGASLVLLTNLFALVSIPAFFALFVSLPG